MSGTLSLPPSVVSTHGRWVARQSVLLAVDGARVRVAGLVAVHQARAQRATVLRQHVDVLHLRLQPAAAGRRAITLIHPVAHLEQLPVQSPSSLLHCPQTCTPVRWKLPSTTAELSESAATVLNLSFNIKNLVIDRKA